jgi:cytochrome oxidase Cu insertion factor (SCO1/SenC/PrrC family)
MSRGPDPVGEGAGGVAVRRSNWLLLLMVGIFAAPALAAWFLYWNPQYLPSGRGNLGALISPVVPVPQDLRMTTPTGAGLDRTRLEGKWTLVYLAGGDCSDACRVRLHDLRQIRLALGDGSLSVERLLILTDSGAAATGAALAKEFEGMAVALTDASGAAHLLGALGQGSEALGRVYILDPMGNLMMRYAPDAPAKDTLKDMGRLIKASKNWIKGAGYGHK